MSRIAVFRIKGDWMIKMLDYINPKPFTKYDNLHTPVRKQSKPQILRGGYTFEKRNKPDTSRFNWVARRSNKDVKQYSITRSDRRYLKSEINIIEAHNQRISGVRLA